MAGDEYGESRVSATLPVVLPNMTGLEVRRLWYSPASTLAAARTCT